MDKRKINSFLLKNHLIIFLGLIIVCFLIILFLGHLAPNLSDAIGLIAISSPFIILLYHIKKDREGEKEKLNILRNRLIRIINHIYNIREAIGNIPESLTGDQKEEFKRIRKRKREVIINYILNLSDFGPKLLNILKVEITGIRFESFIFLNKYKFTPSGLKRIDGKIISDISFTPENRDDIIKELNELYNKYS